MLQREAEQSSDRGVRTMALYRIGRLHAERLGNRDEALAALARAAQESPDEPLVLGEVARLYESAEKWEPLAAVLDRLVATTNDPAERVTLLVRAGQLREERRSRGWEMCASRPSLRKLGSWAIGQFGN